METEENFKIQFIYNDKNKIKIKLSLSNNMKIKLKLSFNSIEYIKQFDTYDFHSLEFFDELSPKQIYLNLKDSLKFE